MLERSCLIWIESWSLSIIDHNELRNNKNQEKEKQKVWFTVKIHSKKCARHFHEYGV